MPLVDSPKGVFIGRAAVSVRNGRCLVLAINSTEEEIEVQIPPQELTPYDVFDDESDCLEEILTSGKTVSLSPEERMTLIKEKIKFGELDRHRQQRVTSYQEAIPQLFLLEGDELPGTNLAQHQIPTVDDVPVFRKQYRYPPVHKAEVRRQINKLLESGIISPSSSPYNSPLWIVPKKADQNGNKRWRLVIDFRALSEKTIGDFLVTFSVFDLTSGFHQIPMDPRDKNKLISPLTLATGSIIGWLWV